MINKIHTSGRCLTFQSIDPQNEVLCLLVDNSEKNMNIESVMGEGKGEKKRIALCMKQLNI